MAKFLIFILSAILFSSYICFADQKHEILISIPSEITGNVVEIIPGITEVVDCNEYTLWGSFSTTEKGYEYQPAGRSGTKMFCPDIHEEQFIKSSQTLLLKRYFPNETYSITVPQGYEVRVKVYESKSKELVFH